MVLVYNCRDLMERGNKWLIQNPQYSVSNCESVTWWTTEQMHVGDTEAVLLDQSPHAQPTGDTIYLTGLRSAFTPLSEPLSL